MPAMAALWSCPNAVVISWSRQQNLAYRHGTRCVEAKVIAALNLLILLGLAHFVCDFGLQTDRMAREKISGADVTLNWRWWLTGHAATHGLAVAVLTGVPLLGLAETVLHAIIDWCKGRFRFSLKLDQCLHLACKLLWVGLIVSFRP